jgi:ribosome biogenesis protein MAK21
VNKLGDPDRKVASRATYRLQLLLKKHAVMIPTVVQFIQAYLSRANLAPRGVYNGVVFLNQVLYIYLFIYLLHISYPIYLCMLYVICVCCKSFRYEI